MSKQNKKNKTDNDSKSNAIDSSQSKSSVISDPTVPSEVLIVTYSTGQVPELTRTVASILNVDISFTPSTCGFEHYPYLTIGDNNRGTISGDLNISKYLARSILKGSQIYGCNDAVWTTQVDQWLDYFADIKANRIVIQDVYVQLNKHLEYSTFIVGYQLSLADIALTLVLKRANFISNPALSSEFPNIVRWFNLISPQLPFPKPLNVKKASTSASSKASTTVNKSNDAGAPASNTDANSSGEEGTCPPLENAIDGQVCTRFPPEPSGYLHIGHCKAVLLNQYYAQRYHGKLIVRFDDTNPSKEKEEYEDNILKDLETLQVKADKVSHTSDYFDVCVDLAKKMIASGKAYMDDTDQETMQAERLERKESKHRNSSPEENLRVFNLLLSGDPGVLKYCLRAKIDMTSVNGTMRDPVLYRFNDTPHHRTGTKHKAYPTYDFACPIVDSIEGVTHALRTTEYNDRDEQYHWIQDALGLRSVYIQTFGKINFVNTVLSKRKLTWFVEQNLVEGWFDARFPTIQGCVRRGMNVDALKHFILSQGASKRVITMEWDKFWSENKKLLEDICPRYMAVNDVNKVRLILENVDPVVTGHTVQIHPQKPEIGYRVMRRFNELLLDYSDSKLFKEGEEVTLLRWGNIRIRQIDTSPEDSNIVTTVYASYDASSTNFSKTKKLTWLANTPDLVPITIVEFDHLITKSKLSEDDDFRNYVNPSSRSEYTGLADASVKTLAVGSVIQLERKGFFRVDKALNVNYPNKGIVLFAIPDGKIQKPSK